MKNDGGPQFGGGSKEPPDILQRTFLFAVEVVKLCGKLDERPGVGRVMMSQILRAGTSVPSNVEEAQAGQSKADFISKMSIALKEARETHLRLRLLATASVVPNTETSALIQEADEIKRILGAIIVSAKRNDGAGN
jgi:four helix bundle protein